MYIPSHGRSFQTRFQNKVRDSISLFSFPTSYLSTKMTDNVNKDTTILEEKVPFMKDIENEAAADVVLPAEAPAKSATKSKRCRIGLALVLVWVLVWGYSIVTAVIDSQNEKLPEFSADRILGEGWENNDGTVNALPIEPVVPITAIPEEHQEEHEQFSDVSKSDHNDMHTGKGCGHGNHHDQDESFDELKNKFESLKSYLEEKVSEKEELLKSFGHLENPTKKALKGFERKEKKLEKKINKVFRKLSKVEHKMKHFPENESYMKEHMDDTYSKIKEYCTGSLWSKVSEVFSSIF